LSVVLQSEPLMLYCYLNLYQVCHISVLLRDLSYLW